jgi:hypothetical protein
MEFSKGKLEISLNDFNVTNDAKGYKIQFVITNGRRSGHYTEPVYCAIIYYNDKMGMHRLSIVGTDLFELGDTSSAILLQRIVEYLDLDAFYVLEENRKYIGRFYF